MFAIISSPCHAHHYTFTREYTCARPDGIITDTPIFDALLRAVESEYRAMEMFRLTSDFPCERRRIFQAKSKIHRAGRTEGKSSGALSPARCLRGLRAGRRFNGRPVNVVTHLDHDQFSSSAFAILNWPDKARGRARDKYLQPKKSAARARGMRAKQQSQKSEWNA